MPGDSSETWARAWPLPRTAVTSHVSWVDSRTNWSIASATLAEAFA